LPAPYRQQVATVDTNIYRVLHRVFLGLEHPVAQLSTEKMFPFAQQLLPPGQAYDWHQALMDLGALVCNSSNPHCAACPLQASCEAYREMSQHSLFPGGTVVRQLRKVAEKKATYASEPFVGSRRYFRGRIIAYLRTLPGGTPLALAELGRVLKADFQPDELPWLENIVTSLQRDGLVVWEAQGVTLP
jgi:A/G-specific adenine glycosylase